MEIGVFDQKYKALNAKQKAAVDTVYGPVMVIAGPGTGKTTVLTLRIANILKQTDAKPDEILALTFTESGASAVREKLRELIGDASFRVNIFTFHGFANFLRSRYPECFQKIGGRMPASDLDQIEIIEEILGQMSFRELRVSTYGVSVKSIIGRISELKRENISIDKLSGLIDAEESEFESWQKGIENMNKTRETEIDRKQKYITRMREFTEVFELYEAKLDEYSLYDYNDTILGLIDALSRHPEMLLEVRENFQFVLADEHQDANGAQNEILKFFHDSDSLDLPNIFVVGDDKQSIFRFQGASLENFYNFEREFPKASRIDLENNYRSHQVILDSAHTLISHDGQNHTALSANATFEKKHIEVNEFDTFEDEIQFVARSIEAQLGKIKESETIAVLSRNNASVSELATYLEMLDVDYSIAGEQSLFENFEYQKFKSLFEALVNPLSSPKLIEALFFGFFPVDLHDAFYLEDLARSKRRPVGSILLKEEIDPKELKEKEIFLNAKALVSELAAEAKRKPLLEFLAILEKKLQLVTSSGAFEVLRLLYDEATKLTFKDRTARLEDFDTHLTRLEHHGLAPMISTEEKQSRVKLSSIHKSKGLEYDFVYVIDVTDKRFEKNGRKTDLLRVPGVGVERDLDEERRLIYVALTRAKRHATLSFSLSGLRGEMTAPSQLLDELDPKFVKRSKPEVEKIELLAGKTQISADARKTLQEVFLRRPFSVTALNNYLECPRKYFFRNLLLIPEPYEMGAMLGSAVHNCLERIHKSVIKGEMPSKSEIKKIVSMCVESQPFAQKDLTLALEKVQENITAYIDCFVSPEEGEKLYVEESLKAPLTVNHQKGDFEIMLSGKIDLARQRGEKVEVVDFKTRKRMTRNEIMGETKSSDGSYMRQLQFYKLLWEKARAEETVERATLAFLSPERGRILSETFELSEKDKADIERITIETLIEIHNFDFLKDKCDERECRYCALTEILNL